MADATPTSEVAAPAPVAPRLTFWEMAAQAGFKYVGSIFMEPNGGGKYVTSLGRVALAALLGEAMWQWHQMGRDLVPGMKEVLFALMAYNFGTKGLQSAKDMIESWKTPITPPKE